MKHFMRRLICILAAFFLFSSSAFAYTRLEKGSSGSEVLAMQQALKKLGYSISTDGKFGAATENVVKSFQRANGLTADGIAGNDTLTKLYALAGSTGNSSDSSNNSSANNASGNSSPSLGSSMTATVSTSKGKLNMYLSADTSAKVIGSIPQGAKITIYLYNSSWCYTMYGGVGGYILKEFLSFTSSPTVTPSATPHSNQNLTPTGGISAVVTTANKGALNVRSTPSAGNNIIGSVPNGSQVTVISRNSTWCCIIYNSSSGYVLSEYLSFASSPTATISPTPTPVPSPQQNTIVSGISATVVTTGGTLNLRSAPSSGLNVIGTIPNGAKVTVTARGTTWSSVIYNGKSGYVMSSYLHFSSSPTATASPTPLPSPTPTSVTNSDVPVSGITATVYTGNGALNLRLSPSLGQNIFATIPEGTQVQVLDKGNVWSAVVYNGQAGYVMTSYLRFSAAVTPTPSPTATPQVIPPASTGITAFVNTSSGPLNIRAKEDGNAAIIGKIPNGSQIIVTARGNTWCAIQYGNISGFVMSSFLLFPQSPTATPTITPTPAPTASSPASGITACVTTSGGSLNLRDNPSTNGTVIGQIPNGTGVIVTSRGSAWCAVIYNGTAGYVMTSFLTFLVTNPATPSPVPESGSQVSTYAIVTTSGGSLNLRAEGSTSAKVIDSIPNGATIFVSQKGNVWCAVTYAGTSGYVMTSYLNFTESPPLEDEGPSDPSEYKRTLKKGMVGDDVSWVQNRLKELKYEITLTGSYDDQTIAAVKHFQSQNGLSTDGLAGSLTFSMLKSSNARKADDAPLTYDTLRVDDQGPAVTSMQKALKELGYNVTVNGDFDAATHNAVVAFQQRNGLVISGIADSLTRQVIHGENAKPYSTPVEVLPSDAGVIAGPSISEMKLLHWQDEIKPNVKAGQTFLIFDPNTNISWNLKFYSLGRHADSQPATWRDTQLMNRSFGSTSWTIHPVYVLLPTGQWTMATMHNMPHLFGSINDNGFGGHLCVHFLRDMAEAERNDPNYGVNNQKTLRNAWKALTGETISR